MRPEKKVKVTH
jgi:hypothetical protein